jgi:hypothetical protein
MLSSDAELPTAWVKAELRRLRQGQGLAHPAAVMQLDAQLRRFIVGDMGSASAADEILRLVGALRWAIGKLSIHERLFAQVDFNLSAEHSYPTLTDRQESLARERKCAAKTVRRHAEHALDTLALIIVSGDRVGLTWQGGVPMRGAAAPASHEPRDSSWRRTLCAFWRLAPEATVDVVCSEIPEPERPGFATPNDRNYLRYAKFADLDSLIYVRTRLAQACPDLTVRDFSPSEHFNTDADNLIVIGGPPWNAKFREFLPQLPFYFEPHPLGEDDPVVFPVLDGRRLAPRWTANCELLEDLAVFTRLTLARGTTVFLLGGCLTLGVLAAAQCFLHGERGASNAAHIGALVGEADFVLVVEARRLGGITDVADIARVQPLLLLARRDSGAFQVVSDQTKRYSQAQ